VNGSGLEQPARRTSAALGGATYLGSEEHRLQGSRRSVSPAAQLARTPRLRTARGTEIYGEGHKRPQLNFNACGTSSPYLPYKVTHKKREEDRDGRTNTDTDTDT